MTTPAPVSTDPVGVRPPGYRLPDATRVGGVRLQVADLDRSLAFYTGVLGFRVLERGEGTATLGADRPFVELVERPGARPVPRRGLLGLFHVAFLLPDRAALGRFLQHLADIDARVGMSDHHVSEAVYLNDPDGLGIEVYADRPRSQWRYEGAQIEMVTVPMDIRSVIAAGGGRPWTGAPDGTTVGHVHLSVDQLGTVERFYHAALGFDEVVWSYPGALFLSAGGYHHHLGTNTWAGQAPVAGPDDARLLAWTLVVPTDEDAEAVAVSAEAGGYPVTREDDGSRRVLDPWGMGVRVVAE